MYMGSALYLKILQALLINNVPFTIIHKQIKYILSDQWLDNIWWEHNVHLNIDTVVRYITGKAKIAQKIQYNTPYTDQSAGCSR